MRVITGTARGVTLRTADGYDVRPTTGKVKEAMFSSIQFEVAGAHVLDLYAGSGQLGIEAISRGALDCVFVDSSRESLSIITENLKKTRFIQNANVINNEVLFFLSKKGKKYDIVFADPPYGSDDAVKLLPLVSDALMPNGLFVLETGNKITLPETDSGLSLVKRYGHGLTAVWLYRKEITE